MAKATNTNTVNDGNYTDPRFTKVNESREKATNDNKSFYEKQADELNAGYDEAISGLNEHTEKMVNAQNEQTDLAIEKLETEQKRAEQDYIKEQSAAYTDWQKQSNQYGANAEAMASQGLTNTGYSESSQVSMYNAYQNRVAVARQSFERVSADFNLGMAEARAQNSAALAEIYYNAYKEKSALILSQIVANQEIWKNWQTQQSVIDSRHDNLWQNVLTQINTEKSQALQERAVALDEAKFKYQKEQDAKAAAKATIGGDDGDEGSTKPKTTTKTRSYSTLPDNQFLGTKGKNAPSKDPEVDSKSVLALGYGPISGSRLNELEQDGYIESYVEDGKIKFRKVKTQSIRAGGGAAGSKGRPMKVALK